MFAQSILEYGSVSSFVEAMQALASSVLDGLREVPQSTWAIAGAVALLAIMLFGRRSR